MEQIIREFLQVVDLYYGTYLDGITSFAALIEEINDTEREMQSQRPDLPPDSFAGAPFNYSKGAPRQPNSIHLHGCTLGEYRERNTPGGRNHKTLGQMFVVTIYGYWEDHFRLALACALDFDSKDVIQCDTMGDMAYIRNAIVHHRGIATDRVSKCKVLQWFKEGDEISFTPEQMEMVVSRLKNGLPDELKKLEAELHSRGAKVKPTGKQVAVEKVFPTVAQWVNGGYGHIEIGDQEGFGFIARALDYGGWFPRTTNLARWPSHWPHWKRRCRRGSMNRGSKSSKTPRGLRRFVVSRGSG